MRSGVALSTSSGMLGCSTARQVHGVPKCTTTHTKWARETNENYQQWRQCTDRDTFECLIKNCLALFHVTSNKFANVISFFIVNR
jgi:hypothetical protein